jgi:hypothetical protein
MMWKPCEYLLITLFLIERQTLPTLLLCLSALFEVSHRDYCMELRRALLLMLKGHRSLCAVTEGMDWRMTVTRKADRRNPASHSRRPIR